MADQFAKWDKFMENYNHTKDARRALRWTAYQLRIEEKRRKQLVFEADMLAADSLARINAEQRKANLPPPTPNPGPAGTLSDEQVMQVRQVAREKGSRSVEIQRLALSYGMGFLTLSRVARGLSYKHLNAKYSPAEE